MKNYLVQFASGNNTIITQTEFDVILDGKLGDVHVNLSHVDYIIPISEESGIIKPPTPAELKAQEERNKEVDDITLEGQLSKL